MAVEICTDHAQWWSVSAIPLANGEAQLMFIGRRWLSGPNLPEGCFDICSNGPPLGARTARTHIQVHTIISTGGYGRLSTWGAGIHAVVSWPGLCVRHDYIQVMEINLRASKAGRITRCARTSACVTGPLTFSITIRPPYNRHKTTIQSTKDGPPSSSTPRSNG